MLLSRKQSAVIKAPERKKKVPTLREFFQNRDFTGALTYLEFYRDSGSDNVALHLYIAYSAFHLSDFNRAAMEYLRLLEEKSDDTPPEVWNYLACCFFCLGDYKQAKTFSKKGPNSPLQNRLHFHLALKLGDKKLLVEQHKQLQDAVEDHMTLAAMHYLRSNYEEAIGVYQALVERLNTDRGIASTSVKDCEGYLALSVYLALCYHKLGYYDVSQGMLDNYLNKFPDSVIAKNLKACNHFRVYELNFAVAELTSLQKMLAPSNFFAKDIINHNLVVFSHGNKAVPVLRPLIDVIPEARLNLAIHHLKRDNISAAHDLIKDLEPFEPDEYILKGCVMAAYGQHYNSPEHIQLAIKCFTHVGNENDTSVVTDGINLHSESKSIGNECLKSQENTSTAKQCLASVCFLLKQFRSVELYLNAIKKYFYTDDTFHFNFAQAKAANNKFKDAEDIFLLVRDEALRNDTVYLTWLARCYIMNKKPRKAWELYLNIETFPESLKMLYLIANDCYKLGQFYYAAKAFDVLEKFDNNPVYWEGKRGACIGVIQMILAGHEPTESKDEIIKMLRGSLNPEAGKIIKFIEYYAKKYPHKLCA